jgi:hypothetical protein
MARRRSAKKFYRYECTLTGKTFKRGIKTEKTDELISVEAYYKLNPEKDDRPELAKKQLNLDDSTEESLED